MGKTSEGIVRRAFLVPSILIVKKTGTQRCQVTYPRSHSPCMSELRIMSMNSEHCNHLSVRSELMHFTKIEFGP